MTIDLSQKQNKKTENRPKGLHLKVQRNRRRKKTMFQEKQTGNQVFGVAHLNIQIVGQKLLNEKENIGVFFILGRIYFPRQYTT